MSETMFIALMALIATLLSAIIGACAVIVSTQNNPKQASCALIMLSAAGSGLIGLLCFLFVTRMYFLSPTATPTPGVPTAIAMATVVLPSSTPTADISLAPATIQPIPDVPTPTQQIPAITPLSPVRVKVTATSQVRISTPVPAKVVAPTLPVQPAATETPIPATAIQFRNESIGFWIYQGDRPPMPAPAGENEIILAHGDIDNSGTCHMKRFGTGVAVAGLGEGSFQLWRIAGTPEQIEAAVNRHQIGAAQHAGTDCPEIQ